ncbi:MAG: glutamine synthetase family protein [Pseudomonadota bacterium]
MTVQFADTPLSPLQERPEIASLRVGVCDLNGVLRGKRLPLSEAAKALEGIALPMSTSLVDLWGADLAHSPYLDAGDPDGVALPTGQMALPMPWLTPPSILLPAAMMRPDGSPSPLDPRHILARLCARARDMGLTVVSAVELEFYVFNGKHAPQGLAAEGVLDLADLSVLEPFLADIEQACATIGISTGAVLSEGGGGQVEINLPHSPDPLAVADQALLFRQVVRGVAQAHGLQASFMAVPREGSPGNGQHVHLSLLDGSGRNVFDDGSEAGSDLLGFAIAGVLDQMSQASLILAPHGNSHRRLHRGHAPSHTNWAYDSRFAAVRVPSGAPAARRLEHRVAGADANTYLVLAAILNGVLDGIEARTAPPAPFQEGANGPPLPLGWVRARDAFAGSQIMKILMGDEAHGLFLALRDQEAARMEAPISNLERTTLMGAL